MTHEEATLMKFRDEAEKIRIRYSPVLQHGLTIGYNTKSFNERMENMKKEIINIAPDLPDSIKEEVANGAKQKITDCIDAHNNKEHSS